MSRLVLLVVLLCPLLVVTDLGARTSLAADVEVRLTDGRTLRGSVIESQSNEEQLALEIRSAGIALRRTLSWKQIAAGSDALLLMAYWSERKDCPKVERHCAGTWTRANVALARRLAGRPGVLIHIIGGIGSDISTAELRAFIAAALDAHADGASIYDVATTDPAWWRDLAALRDLGR